MNFGEKLLKLRKEKGLSQEMLADQLGTTRQAVSKWENNQGYPETEKLLQLSHLFAVSTDYLLKAEKSDKAADEKGYYVSREMANGFLANEKRGIRFLAFGLLCGALAGIPAILFENQPAVKLIGIAVIAAVGIIAVIFGMFAEQEQYKVLKEEPLLFDPEVLRALRSEYAAMKKKSTGIAIFSTILFVLAMLALILSNRGIFPWSGYSALLFLSLSIGLFGFVMTLGTLEAYEILAKNEQYASRFLFKVRRRIKEKVAKL